MTNDLNEPRSANNAPAHSSANPSGTGTMSRRKALKYIGAGTGAVLIGGTTGYLGYNWHLQLPASEAARLKGVRFVVVGGSIGGLTVAARLLRAVPDADITVIEPRAEHHYQPGYTLVGAGVYTPKDVKYSQQSLFLPGVKWVKEYVQAFEPDQNRVRTRSGDLISYDYLVVGLGVENNNASVEGFEQAMQAGQAATIYDLQSAVRYREMAAAFERGKALFTFPAGYVKCGGAPQKITWLSEDLWRRAGHRDNIEVHFHTNHPSLFPTVPRVEAAVTPLVEARGVQNHFRQQLMAVDPSTRTAYFSQAMSDGSTREIRQQYDLLHVTPRFRTPLPLREGPLTTEGIGGQIEVDRETLQHKRYANIFGVGDCAATGAAKTAATIRKQAPVVVGNLIDLALDRAPSHRYDGTSGCPLLTRYGRCMMFEFDFQGNLVNEWLYQSTRETRVWWNFKVHGLRQLYRHVMMNGYV